MAVHQILVRWPRAAGLVVVALWSILEGAGQFAGALGDDRDVAAEFKAAKSAIQQQLRDRKSENRLAAVKKLESFPTLESAKLLFFQGLASSDDEVRRAAFDALWSFTGDKEIANFLRVTVLKQWKGKPQPETYAGLAILLASESPEVRDSAKELVTDAAQRPNQGRIALISLADELATRRGDTVCRALVPLTDLPLFESDFAFRRAVVQALTRIRSKAAVTRLIELLSTAKGEVRSDIVRYLTDLSEEQHGIDAAAWETWWSKRQESFDFPPEAQPDQRPGGFLAQPRPKQPGAGPSYYGLPLSGAKIVFILDTSGSMRGPRIVAAKRELVRAINELPGDVAFTVVVFNDRAFPWQAKLVPASPENKQNATYFVELQPLGNKTASFDALEAAMSFDAEAVYFVTDGDPTAGRIQNVAEIVRTITRLNQFRRMTIHALGIGVSNRAFETFLSTLAEQNWGEFQRVDQ